MRDKIIFITSILFILCGANDINLLKLDARINFQETQTVNAWIIMKTNLIDNLESMIDSNSQNRSHEVYAILTSQAEDSQSDIIDYLTSNNIKHKSFWIKNAIKIINVTKEIVLGLLERDDIESIDADIPLLIIKSVESQLSSSLSEATNNSIEWGIQKIGAPSVWKLGFTGKGIVVANIDTGVRYTHEALVDNYRGNLGDGTFVHDYNWYDPPTNDTSPDDNIGHGSHTMGTMIGAKKFGIGVAVDAKWIACRGCSSFSCTKGDLLTCAQFIVCPTDLQGKNPNCSKAPHVVSNSWGGSGGDTWFYDVVKAMRTAGIIPVFSAGNSGSACETIASPSDYDIVISIGATDINDTLGIFSSRGPGPVKPKFSEQKPFISAPGVNIRSASNSNDNSYKTLSGTSMSSPHVGGAVAILLSKKRTLNFDQIETILSMSASRKLNEPAAPVICGSKSYSVYPNYIYGYGRLNLTAAVLHLATEN